MSKEQEEIVFWQEVIKLFDDGKVEQIPKRIEEFLEKREYQVGSYFLNMIKIVDRAVGYKIDSLKWNDIQNLENVFQYLSQKYSRKRELSLSAGRKEDVIWWCWLQGLDNAPPIVKACYNSLGILNKKINIITAENYKEYVDIPDYILDKWKKGIISDTHFSDILRAALLNAWGGIWCDATVLVTGTQDIKMMENNKLFAYRHLGRGMESRYIAASSWLISADSDSAILNETKEMLYEYWKNENDLKHYFTFHMFFTMACLLNGDEWETVPTVSNIPPQILQNELFKPYTKSRWEQICRMSDFHKLTYKEERPGKEDILFYDYIIENYNSVV